ncbi:MAG TPA: hypothetical protein PLX69_11835 [Leptospiraceae bacterium]|nr:hypothetical protein [Leptospiraceae bacterium]HRG75240.1 hypothetical protein [Leptospiraceae bacterium]
MKTLNIMLAVTLLAFTSLFAETQQECTKKAMDANKEERKACDSKKGDENKACKKEATDKLTAAKNSCAELNKK